MKETILIAFVLAALLAGFVAVVFSNPLRQPETAIRESLLQDTPLGSSLSVVRVYAQEQGWDIQCVNEEGGFYDQRTRPAKVTGQQSLRASLGDYHSPFLTEVTVFWGFDEQSRLMDIWVWKVTDAL